jgi:pimeloyl-ACP methyl ester carboxylesterase
LSNTYTPLPAAPAWFRQALEVPREHLEIRVDGCAVHGLASGPPGRSGLVFIHGGGANAYWWTHVAALLSSDFRVVAVDLSGHGDSQHRTQYSFEQWSDEVMALAGAAEIEGPPVLIGHSMGGMVAITTGARYPAHLSGAIVCDSPVTAESPESDAPQLRRASQRRSVYQTEAEIVGRFRTLPAQDHYLDYVIDHVAHQSVRRTPEGWQWKVDAQLFAKLGTRMVGQVAAPYLSQVCCRLALLRSEFGLVTPDVGQYMYNELGRVAPVITLPQSGHHAMLDEPLILLTAIRALLGDWEHSRPHQRPGVDDR